MSLVKAENDMVKVININGNLVELPEPSAKLSKAESPDGRFSKPKNKISKIQRAELRMKFGGVVPIVVASFRKKGGMPIMLSLFDATLNW